MGKSLEEVMRKMQLEHEQRVNERKAEEEKAAALYERQRRQWQERNRMYEAIAPAAASSAAAGAGGNINRVPQFLAFNQDGYGLFRLNQNGSATEFTSTFTGITVFANCAADPNFIYFVTMDDETDITFGKINKYSHQRIDIDTTVLREETSETPMSLLWQGENFVYLDSNYYTSDDDSFSDYYTISLDGQNVSYVGSMNHDSVWPDSLFIYEGQLYSASLYYPFISGLFTVDLDGMTMDDISGFSMAVESLPENVGPSTKVWLIFDVSVVGGKVYCSVVYTDKDNGATPYCGLGEINMTNQYITLVHDYGVFFSGNEYSAIAAI